MRRYLRQCADFAKWTLVLAMVTLTLLILAGRFVVNQLSAYQPSIENWLSEALGAEVEAGQVSGDWQGVLPLIRLGEVQVGGANPFVHIDHLELEPDYLRSIYYRTLVVREMEVEGVRVALQEDTEGRWSLGGLGGGADTDPELMDSLFASLTRSERILLRQASLNLSFYDGRQMTLNLDQLTAQNAEDFSRFTAYGSVDSENNQLSLVAEFGEGVGTEEGQVGAAYLHFDGESLGSPLATLIRRFVGDQQSAEPSINTEIWFELYPDRNATFQGRVAVDAMPLRIGGESATQVDFSADLAGNFAYAEEIRLDFISPAIELNEQQLSVFDFSLRQQLGAESWDLVFSTPRFALGELYQQLDSRELIGGGLSEILAQLNPRGTISNLHLSVDLREPGETLLLRGNLEGVDLDAFVRAPSVRNLDGYFEAAASSGFVQLAGEQIAPHYEGVYDNPFLHESMRGTVAWDYDPETSAVRVFSDNLIITGAEGDIRGAFLVSAPARRRAFLTELTLMVELANSNARFWPNLVPRTLPEVVHNWLDINIGSALIPAGGFVYRGTLGGGPLQNTAQLRLALDEAELRFADGWPGLTGVSADMFVNNSDILVDASEAQMGGIKLAGSRVEIRTGQDSGIAVMTEFQGSGNEILDLIRATPVRGRVGAALDEFDLHGDVSGSLDIDFPLAASFPADQLRADIRARLTDNSLILTERNIEISQLDGNLHFDQRGLWSDSLSGQLWSQPLELRIDTQEAIGVDLDTRVSIEDLANWLDTDLLDPIEGVSAVTGRIEIAGSGSDLSASYTFRSPLVGVSSQLPEPLGKTAALELPLEIASNQTQSGSQLQVFLGQVLEAVLLRDQERQLTSLSFGLNTAAPRADPGQLRGIVSLADLQVGQWTDLLGSAAGSATGELAQLEPAIEISAQRTLVGERQLGSVHAVLNRLEDRWNLDFATTWGQGIYSLQAGATTAVPLLHFRALDIDAWLQQGEEEADAVPESDPRDTPGLDIRIDSLSFKDRDFGSWQFRLNPTDEGLRVDDVSATIGNIRVIGADQASRLLWKYEDGVHSTQADLSLEFANAAEIFALLGQPAVITSQRGSFYASFAWQGKPAGALDQPLSGIAGVRLENGEFATEVEGVGNALMRVVGLFNINSWARRLQFDFSDVTSRGTSYDQMRGDFVLDQGVLTTLTPVDAQLTSGRMRFDGQINLNEGSVDAQLVATLPLRENMTWVTGLVAGLPAAAGVWLIGKLFQSEVESLTSVSYRISGDLDDPDVRTERVFESTIGGD